MNSLFLSSFGLFAYTNKSNENEILRIALAGCISHTTVETGFHMIDTVNIRSKANPHLGSSSMLSLVSKIWAKEGIIGFGRGFSAAFYGGLFSGFIYFSLYIPHPPHLNVLISIPARSSTRSTTVAASSSMLAGLL